MIIVTIIGARPQFIKAAVLSRQLRKEHKEVLVHTGQHYDANMSSVFFKELEIPNPDYHLGIGSGPHGRQIGEMLKGIEKVLQHEMPDWALVYGDTNSTLAGALAAAKLNIKVAHVEAGLRSFNRRMPEELNRILTDHISSLLLCPTPTAVVNLHKEGINNGVHIVGDAMYNALIWGMRKAEQCSNILNRLGVQVGHYLLATVHRAENTDNPARMRNILEAFNQFEEPLVWPVHPRTQKVLDAMCWEPREHIILVAPLGYLDMIMLEKHARVILTDSGGMQKEACWLQVPCVTLRDETEWVETVESGWNHLAGTETESIIHSTNHIAWNELHGNKNDEQDFQIEKVISLLHENLQ